MEQREQQTNDIKLWNVKLALPSPEGDFARAVEKGIYDSDISNDPVFFIFYFFF